jgi:hypothetical protein
VLDAGDGHRGAAGEDGFIAGAGFEDVEDAEEERGNGRSLKGRRSEQ